MLINPLRLINKVKLFLTKIYFNLLKDIHFRGKYRFLHYLCPKNTIVEDDLFGYKVKLDLSDWIQRNIFLRSFYHNDKIIIENVLKEGMTFIDVGSNIGYFSLLASQLVGDKGLVIAFEPNFKPYSYFKKTIENNSIKNIELYNYAIGDKEGDIWLYPNHEDKYNATATLVDVGQKDRYKVKTNTLDNIIEKLNLKDIDYLKIDVDGYEPNVLEGAINALQSRKIKNMQLEFGTYLLKANNYSSEKLYKLILNYGYKDMESDDYPSENQITDRFFSLQ